MSATVTTGDDTTIFHTLKKNGVTFNIPSTAVVTARLITLGHDIITAEVVQVDTDPGADWPNSLIAVNLPANITTVIADGSYVWNGGEISAKLETQVDDGKKLTWFESITIIKGTIL